MTEMVYKPNREPAQRLADGEYCGIRYYVLSFGTHPCAYIRLPEECEAIGTNEIKCHGGITYTGDRLATCEGSGFYIGWDYAHLGDYAGWMDRPGTGYRWSTREIMDECEDVIDQVLGLAGNPGGAGCTGCAWLRKRRQKCSTCRRNRRMKDNYKEG